MKARRSKVMLKIWLEEVVGNMVKNTASRRRQLSKTSWKYRRNGGLNSSYNGVIQISISAEIA